MTIEVAASWVSPFLLTLARVGGLMIFAPFFGSEVIPPFIRVLLSVALSVAFFPLLLSDLPMLPAGPGAMFTTIGGEFLIGMVLGLVAKLLLGSLQLAGQIMGFQMGFSMINVIDPQTQVETPVMSILQNIVGILVFLSINGHHWFIEAVVDSYRIVGFQPAVSTGVVEALIKSTGAMFVLGMKLAAPVAVVLLIVDILLGVVGRAAPQIHVLVVGLPAKSLMGLIFLAATIHSTVTFLSRHLGGLHEELYRYLYLMAK